MIPALSSQLVKQRSVRIHVRIHVHPTARNPPPTTYSQFTSPTVAVQSPLIPTNIDVEFDKIPSASTFSTMQARSFSLLSFAFFPVLVAVLAIRSFPPSRNIDKPQSAFGWSATLRRNSLWLRFFYT
jgi:hypothetical protein